MSRHGDADEILAPGPRLPSRPIPAPARGHPGTAATAGGGLPAARRAAGQRIRGVIEPPDPARTRSPATPSSCPDEEITRDPGPAADLAKRRAVAFDRTSLRWDREWAAAQAPVTFDGERSAPPSSPASSSAPPRPSPSAARTGGARWGAVAARDGQPIGRARNQHRPSGGTRRNFNGDPRDVFARGVRPTLLHRDPRGGVP